MTSSVIRSVVLIPTLGLGACVARRPLPAPIDVDLAHGVCQAIRNSYECAELIEANQLPRANACIVRRGNTICFRVGLFSESCVSDEEEVKTFFYLGTLSRPPYHVLWVQYSEGNAVLLVNVASGKQVLVDQVPAASPDGKYLAVASADRTAAYSPNRFSVWAVHGDALARVWFIEPKDWSPGDVHWIDPTTVMLTRFRVDPETGNDVKIDTVTVRLDHGVWQLSEGKGQYTWQGQRIV